MIKRTKILLRFFSDRLSSQEIEKLKDDLVEHYHMLQAVFCIIRDVGCVEDDITDVSFDEGSLLINFRKKEMAKQIEDADRKYSYGRESYLLDMRRKSNIVFITADKLTA